MTQYEFGGMLYRNSREMHLAAAEMWISADGRNDRGDIRLAFDSRSDEELADEMMTDWPSDEDDDDGFRDREPLTREDLMAAFSDLRVNFGRHFAE